MRKQLCLKLGLLLLTFCFVGYGYATDYTWVGTTSAWATSTNWSPAAPAGGPTSADRVIINTVVSPKLFPSTNANITVRSVIMTSARLSIGAGTTFTVLDNLTIAGADSKVLGSGKVVVGSASTRATTVAVGDNASGMTFDSQLTAYSNSVTLSNVAFKLVTTESDALMITGCSFGANVSFTKTGSAAASVNGTVTFAAVIVFVNQGTGSLLFGNSGADNITFTSTTTITNNSTGPILFGNSDDDFFSFKAAPTFNKTSSGAIEIARYGNTEVFRHFTFNNTTTEDVVVGNTGGGNFSFKGTIDQYIMGTATQMKFNKLTIDKIGANVTPLLPVVLIAMPGATAPEPQLNLLNGLLVTNKTTTPLRTLTIPDGTVVTMNPADPSKSFVNGPVTKTGVSAFTFPVGKDPYYRPVSISALATSSTFTAENFYVTAPPVPTALATDITSLSYCEYWTLTRDQGTADVGVTLSWANRGCEIVQPTGVKLCKYNTVSGKWETVPATQDNVAHVLTTTANLATYGNLALGYSIKRIVVDTRSLETVGFTITGAQLPEDVQYASGLTGVGRSQIPLLPVPPGTGTSPILITIPEGDENEAMKIKFDIDNTSAISNVVVSMDNSETFTPMNADFYTINNTLANGKTLTFIKGDERVAPTFATSLVDGTVMLNSSGTNFTISGMTGITITSFKIFSVNNVLVKGPLTTNTWDGTDLNGVEVSNGTYKFELILTSQGTSYTYNGHILVK